MFSSSKRDDVPSKLRLPVCDTTELTMQNQKKGYCNGEAVYQLKQDKTENGNSTILNINTMFE